MTWPDLDRAERDARELVVFADGVEEGGHRVYAQRARVAARDVLALAELVRTEQSARRVFQAERDRLLRQFFPGAFLEADEAA